MSNTLKNIAYSVFFIASCLMLGRLLSNFIGGLPASLYGMILLNFMLYLKVIEAKKIQQSIAWIINNMGVCFVPAGVGIINHFDLLAKHGIIIISIIFFSTFILISFVGIIIERLSTNLPDKVTSPNE